MKSLRFVAPLLVGLCLLAGPALAFTQVSGTGTGGAVANTAFFGGTSGNIVTTVALNPGDIAVAYMQQNAPGTPTFSVSDAFGNTWQAAPGIGVETGTGAATEIWYSVLTNSIPNGSNIHHTNSLAAGYLVTVAAFRPAGTGAFDTNATGQHGTGTSVTVGPTPTLACPGGGANCGVCVGGAEWHSSGTTASDAAFTTVGGTGAGNLWVDNFKFVSSTAAVSQTDTNTSNVVYGAAMACFKDTVSAAIVHHSLGAMGAGN